MSKEFESDRIINHLEIKKNEDLLKHLNASEVPVFPGMGGMGKTREGGLRMGECESGAAPSGLAVARMGGGIIKITPTGVFPPGKTVDGGLRMGECESGARVARLEEPETLNF